MRMKDFSKLLICLLAIAMFSYCAPITSTAGDGSKDDATGEKAKADGTAVDETEEGKTEEPADTEEKTPTAEVSEFFKDLSGVEDEKPSDSSGTDTSFNLSFAGASNLKSAFSLVNATESDNSNDNDSIVEDTDGDGIVTDGLLLKNGAVITLAKLSIAGIKVNAKHDRSTKEKEFVKKIFERLETIDEEEKLEEAEQEELEIAVDEEEILVEAGEITVETSDGDTSVESDSGTSVVAADGDTSVATDDGSVISTSGGDVDISLVGSKELPGMAGVPKPGSNVAKSGSGSSNSAKKPSESKAPAGKPGDKFKNMKGSKKEVLAAKVKDVLEQAKKKVERIVAEAKEEAKLDKTVRHAGPFVVDLLTKTVTPSLDTVKLKDGSYKRIEFKLAKHHSKIENDPLNGHVLYVEGYFLDAAGEKVKFAVISDRTEVIQIRGKKGFKLDADNTKFGIIFRIRKWFEGIQFDGVRKVALEKRLEWAELALSKVDAASAEYDKKKETFNKFLEKAPDTQQADEIKERLEKSFERMDKKVTKVFDAAQKKIEAEIKKVDRFRERHNIPADIQVVFFAGDPKFKAMFKRLRHNIKTRIRMGHQKDDGSVDTSDVDFSGEIDEDTADAEELEIEKEDEADGEDEADHDDIDDNDDDSNDNANDN